MSEMGGAGAFCREPPGNEDAGADFSASLPRLIPANCKLGIHLRAAAAIFDESAAVGAPQLICSEISAQFEKSLLGDSRRVNFGVFSAVFSRLRANRPGN